MEQRIAKLLKGSRVPMSGSGTLKGDCFVPLDEYRTIYVECKLTQNEMMIMPQKWFFKIQQEAKAMRCVFGILVVHFVSESGDWVLIPEHGVRRLEQELEELLPVHSIHETVYSKKGIAMRRNFFIENPYTWLQFEEGLWTIMPLLDFSQVLQRITERNNSQDIE